MDSAHVVESLHQLYLMTFTPLGRRVVPRVLGMDDNLLALLPFAECSGTAVYLRAERSQCWSSGTNCESLAPLMLPITPSHTHARVHRLFVSYLTSAFVLLDQVTRSGTRRSAGRCRSDTRCCFSFTSCAAATTSRFSRSSGRGSSTSQIRVSASVALRKGAGDVV